MSERNLDSMRHAIDAYNAHDIEELIAQCDPGIRFYSAFATAGGATYDGHDGIRRWYGDVLETWGDAFRVEPEAFFDLGEHVLAFYLLKGRGRHSGVDVEMPVALVTRWRDGLIVEMKGYAHREDALNELGVIEAGIEPIRP